MLKVDCVRILYCLYNIIHSYYNVWYGIFFVLIAPLDGQTNRGRTSRTTTVVVRYITLSYMRFGLPYGDYNSSTALCGTQRSSKRLNSKRKWKTKIRLQTHHIERCICHTRKTTRLDFYRGPWWFEDFRRKNVSFIARQNTAVQNTIAITQNKFTIFPWAQAATRPIFFFFQFSENHYGPVDRSKNSGEKNPNLLFVFFLS